MTDAPAIQVLITGFPAFFARKLLQQLLLAEPQTGVTLLVRASDNVLADEHVAALASEARARVTLLEGDPAALDFGLSGAEYVALSAAVGRVFHFASGFEAVGGSAETAARNIACAREVIEFALAAPRPPGVILLSSTRVSGTRHGMIREDELNQGQSFRGRVEESLATVELMFARHAELEPIVLRTAQIVGDSRTGEIDRLGFPYPWLVFIDRGPQELTVPIPHRPDATLQLVPIDFVVSTAQFLSRKRSAYGKSYHLVDSAPPTLREFLQLAAEASGKRLSATFNPSAFTRGLVGNPGVKMLSKSARGLFDLFAASPHFDTTQLGEALNGSAIACPPVTSYLPTLLERARAGFAANEVAPVDLENPEPDEDLV